MKNEQTIFDLFLTGLLIGFVFPVFFILGVLQGEIMLDDIKGRPEAAPDNPWKALISSEAAIEKGKTIYAASCAVCHGESADGKGAAGAALNPPPRDFIDPEAKWTLSRDPEDIFKSITQGNPGTGMAGFEASINFEGRWALVHYISILPGLAGKFTPLSEESAKELYNEISE